MSFREISITATIAAACVFAAPAVAQTAPAEELIYTVRATDNLTTLARRFMVNEAAAVVVQRRNKIANPRRIPVGARIAIPVRLLRFDTIPLRIATFSGPVTVGGAAATKGQQLTEGALLQTGTNGFVSLVGGDGSRLSLPSQSRARVVRARRYTINGAAAIDLEVLSGRADVTAAKQKPNDTFKVRNPVAVTAIRGTQLRVGFDEKAGAGTSEVLEGVVDISTVKHKQPLEAGFGASARADGEMAREALLPPPPINDPGKVQTEPDVKFSVAPVSGAAAYHVQIARDAGFMDVIAEGRTATTDVSLPDVPNGRMFVRATAISATGIEGFSETSSFRRQQAGISASAAGDAEMGYRFDWMPSGEGTPLFRFQLSEASRPGVPIVDQPGLTTPGLVIDHLKPGTYTWRVGMIQTGPDGSVEVWTDPQKFTAVD